MSTLVIICLSKLKILLQRTIYVHYNKEYYTYCSTIVVGISNTEYIFYLFCLETIMKFLSQNKVN
jgi:hypothetical protein